MEFQEQKTTPPDFNGDFKGFCEFSEALKDATAELLADSSLAGAGEKRKSDMALILRAAFETMVIGMSEFPDEAHGLLKRPMSSMEHAFHSPEAKAYFQRTKSDDPIANAERFVWSFLGLQLARLEGCQKLALDLGAWESLLEVKLLRAQTSTRNDIDVGTAKKSL